MKTFAVIATSLLLTAPVLAQSMGEKTGINSALGVRPTTADFVKEAAIGDMFEIQSSQLAAQCASDQAKDFVSKMLTDHQQTSSDLQSLVSSGKGRRETFRPTSTALIRKCSIS